MSRSSDFRSYLRLYTWWMHPLSRFIKAMPDQATFLDLGCYKGGTTTRCLQLKPKARPYCADIRDMSRVLPADVCFSKFDATRDIFPWPDDFFDVVLCVHLVEHVSEHVHLFGEILRVLRPGGGRT